MKCNIRFTGCLKEVTETIERENRFGQTVFNNACPNCFARLKELEIKFEKLELRKELLAPLIKEIESTKLSFAKRETKPRLEEYQCTTCKEVKSRDEFPKSNYRNGGVQSRCKLCTKKVQKRYYKRKESKAWWL